MWQTMRYVFYVEKCSLVRIVKKLSRFLDFFDQTFLGLELSGLFPARESLVSDIPAEDENIAKPFFYSACNITRNALLLYSEKCTTCNMVILDWSSEKYIYNLMVRGPKDMTGG